MFQVSLPSNLDAKRAGALGQALAPLRSVDSQSEWLQFSDKLLRRAPFRRNEIRNNSAQPLRAGVIVESFVPVLLDLVLR